jgi:photosystem II stability/assembly factor-like uncharacterized protein
METPPPLPEPQPEDERVGGARARRAIGLIAVSLVVIGGVGIGYLNPSFGRAPASAVRPGTSAASGYQLGAIDFVTPTTGWAIAVFDDGDYLVLHTTDGGEQWSPELSGPSNGHSTFMRFFDPSDGVFALLGARPLLYRTTDGGKTWSSEAALTAQASVLAWSFTDPANGWMLVRKDPHAVNSSNLYRTSDAGGTWVDLGSPVKAPDFAYGVAFARGGTGWLVSMSGGAYAYESEDYGRTWSRVALPAPAAGWPRDNQFLVSAQPLGSAGAIVSVVTFAPTIGRSGTGGAILGYPPLTVREFDGGVPVTYTYGVASDTMTFASSDLVTSNSLQVEAPNQQQLVSLDGGVSWSSISLPTSPGAIGVSDMWDWWWIGSGSWSVTADAGKTWTDARNIMVPQPLAGSLQLLDARHARFVAMAGSRLLLVSTDDGGIDWRISGFPPMSSRFTP